MFERVIAQTIQKITAETLQERSLIPLVDILQDPRIPARIKPFFETEVHWWLYNEHLARAANKRFDYEHPELTSLLNYIEQVQFRHARFEREEFISVLDSGVKLTYNYLCRPQTTLKWYIFRGQPVKPLNEVMLRFSAFGDYEYFRTVFIEWVDRKRAERPTFDAISATEFERVIRRTDDQILLNCTVEDLLELMGPLFEFIGEGDEQKVPVDALVIFFDDKNIKRLVDQLEAYRDRGGTEVGREGFVALLDELLGSADDEPETDFSSVYQNDTLDDVVRLHLQGGQKEAMGDGDAPEPYAEPMQPQAAPVPPVETEPMHDSAPHPEPMFDAPHRYTTFNAHAEAGEPDNEDPLLGALGEGFDEDQFDSEIAQYDPLDDDDLIGGDDPIDIGDLADEDLLADDEDDDDDLIDDEDINDDDISVDFDWPEGDSPEPIAQQPVFSSLPLNAPENFTIVDEPDDFTITEEPAPEIHLAEPAEEFSHPDINGVALTETLPTITTESAPVLPEISPAFTLADVRRFIDAALERKVLKKIFDRNRAAYEAALDRLNAAPNWRLASQVLDEIFIKYEVDPYSRTAIRFTDSMYGRYLA